MALTKVTGQVIKNTTDVTVGVLTVTNTLAVGGTVSIGGTLTYEDVTNVDAVGLITARNGIVVGSGITLSKDGDGFFTGIVTATTFSGALAASSLTGALPAISAANLTNVPAANITGTLPAISGANLTNLDASDLASGTVPTARLGSGTASSSTFLRGDSTFAAVTSTTINNNANNRVITGSGSANTLEGESGLLFDGTDTLEMGTAAGGSGYDSNMKLRIGRSSDAQICIRNTGGDTNYGGLIFGDNSSSFGGGIQYHHNGDSMRFYTAGTTERLRITSSGTVLHGTGAAATQKATNGGLDVACNSLSIVFGADSNSGNPTQARTNNTAKDQRIAAVHYTNAEEPVGVVRSYNDGANNYLYFGGGSSLLNASTIQSFFTATNDTTTSGSERLRINSAGTVNIPAGVTLGAAIDSTAAANTLDDYEEGTWTPDLRFGGGSSGMTYDSNSRHGEYTRVGNLVTFTFRFALTNKGSSTGSSLVYGLPFNCASGNGNYSGASFGYLNGLTNSSRWSAYQTPTIDTNSNYIFLRYVITGTDYSLNHNAASFTNTTDIIARGFYYAS